MERNAGYEIKRLILYDDNKGFVLGENLRAPDPYVTWKITEGQGRRSYDWGHYFPTEEAAVKAVAVRRARETWYLVDDSKFGRVYPAVIGEIYSGAILTNRCPDPKYRQLTLVKETEQ